MVWIIITATALAATIFAALLWKLRTSKLPSKPKSEKQEELAENKTPHPPASEPTTLGHAKENLERSALRGGLSKSRDGFLQKSLSSLIRNPDSMKKVSPRWRRR
ncbi:MAG: hypothetical protein IPJ88_11355 [Myxococcales bacterium]|nr:MAG: hypothetical protein IPJ88_11355 [Myxococcales bacterium]